MDRDFVRDALLQKNYFPNQKEHSHELPPCFNTSALTDPVAKKIRAAGPPFGNTRGHDYVPYTLTRFNGGPRVCGVPHPYPYCRLVLQIHTSWKSIEPKLSSASSAIRATEHSDGRLFKMDYGSHAARSARYIQKSSCAKFVAHADISNFFPSIYTHAIPWAAIGVDKAKQQGQTNAWYDKIDKLIRDCRRAETNGVSIGPGTSSLVAELILSRVDRAIQRTYTFDRYIDDYTAFCSDRQEASNFLTALEFQLSKFNLYLNFNKTHISELPHAEIPEWIDALRVAEVLSKPSLHAVKAFVSRAISLADRYLEGSVLRYAINTLSGASLSQDVGQYAAARLFGVALNRLHICSSLPAFLPYTYDKAGKFVLADELIALLASAVASRRSDAICWSLWLARETKTPIPSALQGKCRRVYDPFATVLLYSIATPAVRGRITNWVKTRVLSRTSSVQERNWILIHYLLNEKKLKISEVGDKTLKLLKKLKINFYS